MIKESMVPNQILVTRDKVRQLYFRLQRRAKSYDEAFTSNKTTDDVHKSILKRSEVEKILAEMRETFGSLLDG